MSGFGRITQETVEAIGSDPGNGRVTQETVEPIGPVFSTARVSQLYCEVLASTRDHARITMLYAEPIGPPGSHPPGVRITQLVAEAICATLFPLPFGGTRVLNPVYPTTKDFGAGSTHGQGGYPA